MNEMTVTPWRISCGGPVTDFTESVFSLGNGELGARGFSLRQKKRRPCDHAVFKAGLFEQIRPGITDMVQLPDVLRLSVADGCEENVHQELDMRRGALIHRFRAGRLEVESRRMVSMADSQLLCVRLRATALVEAEVEIDGAMDAEVCNLPVNDDQMTEETETIRLLQTVRQSDSELVMRTARGGHEIRFLCEIKADRALPARLMPGQSVTVEKRVRVLVDGEAPNPAAQDVWAAHEAAWDALWRDCDILIEGDDRLQGAIRYNVFQLLCNNAAANPEVSIGARGLTHGRYKGNTFWDTDIFLLPFFAWHRPEAAKNLVRYRLNRLPAAKELARRQNLSGARYPWMCAADGAEQCESWDIGLCETHVTADVAYAAARCAEITGGDDITGPQARDMYLETARFWLSRFTWEEEKNQYSSFFVKGPDEYCGAAVNNTFTNYMARHNVRLALKHSPMSAEERARMEHFESHVAILYDPARELFLQDEMFERLEPMPTRKDGGAPLYRRICFDRMQRYRALKQADLVQLMTLFPGGFTRRQMQNVWDAYEPLTVHDSSLSFGAHAQLAFRLGLADKAWEYFEKSVYLDLTDGLCNTGKEGVHMASLGASWQALVYGALGLWSEGGQLAVEPALPPQIKRLSLCVYHRGERYRVTASGTGATVEKEA